MMTVYPGDEPPTVTALARVEEDGYRVHRLTLTTHTGTHVDAPAHLLAQGRTLDRFPVSHFDGPALVVDCRACHGEISRRILASAMDGVTPEFVLLHTGWSRFWGTASYLTGFPVLSHEAAAWLASLPLKGVGVDTISVDRPDADDLPCHRLLLAHEIVIIENLTNLAAIPQGRCRLSCLPLLITDADGAPARVVAECG